MSDGNNDNDNDNNNNNDSTSDWRDALEDLKSHERLSGIKSLKDLAKAYIDSSSNVTLPASVDEYKIPENVKIKGLRSMALANKFTQDQLNGLIKFHEEAANKTLQTTKEKRTAAEASLKQEWGDKYDSNLALARKALEYFDKDKQLTEQLKSAGMANDPQIVRFLHKLSGTLKEGRFIGDDGNPPKPKKSKAQILFPNHSSESDS